MEIKFNCGNCGRKLSAEPEMAGERLPCPECGAEVVVPELGNSQQLTVGSGQYRVETEKRRGGESEKNNREGAGRMLVVVAVLLLVGGGGYLWMKGDFGNASDDAAMEAGGKRCEGEEPAGRQRSRGQGEEGVGGEEEVVPEADEIDEALSAVEIKVVEEKEVESSDGTGWKVEYGDFEIKAGLYRNDIVKVHYSMPLDGEGKALKSASNVVFICPYLPERNFYKQEYHRWWSEVAGYASFSFDIETKLKEIYYKKKCYYYPETGFHDLAFKVKGMLERKYGLESRNILLAGQSSGSIMAKEFVLKYPFKVDAAAYNGGHRNIYLFNPKLKDARTACFVSHCVGDFYQKTDESFPFFIQSVWSVSPPIWKNKGGRFFHHTASPATWNLIHLFVKGVVDLRAANGGVVPKFREWPFSAEKDWGRKRRVYFPSKEFMDAWKAIPNGILERLHDDPTLPEREPVCLIPRAGTSVRKWRSLFGGSATMPWDEGEASFDDGVPKGVVIYIGDPAEDGKKKSVSMIDTLYFFYLRGYAACGLKTTKDKKRSFKRIAKLIKLVSLNADWKNIPKYVIGLGPGGELAAVAALRRGERVKLFKDKIKKGKVTFFKKRVVRHPLISGIVAINSRYSTKSAYTSMKKARGKSHLPLTLIYSSDSAELAPRLIPKRTKVEKMKVKGYTLGKKWFEVIDKSVGG